MSAERLREAAKVLRERATAATPGPWEMVSGNAEPFVAERGRRYFGMTAIPNYGNRDYGKADATYISTAHPGVGLALANALDSAADYDPLCDDGGDGEGMYADLCDLARLIVDGAA